MIIKIAHLYPDLLNLYGDRGNIASLTKRLRWRGIETEVTEYSIDDIKAMGFPDSVVEALVLMTHDKSVPYMDYVAKIKENLIAKAVKLADLRHNSDLSRLDVVDEKAIKRVKKYKDAIGMLNE